MINIAVVLLGILVMLLCFRVWELGKIIEDIDGDIEQLFNESEEQFVFHIEGDDNNVIN